MWNEEQGRRQDRVRTDESRHKMVRDRMWGLGSAAASQHKVQDYLAG